MASRQLVRIARRILPSPARRILSPVYRWVRDRYYALRLVTRTNFTLYRLGDQRYRLRYTSETIDEFTGRFEDEKIQPENISLDRLTARSNVDAFIDIGGYFGFYTVLGTQLNPDLTTIVFEPDQYNRSVLREVLQENDIQAEVRQEVVSDYSGVITFYADPTDGSQSHTTAPQEGFESRMMDCISLSALLEEREIDSVFVKIDAEGGESKILEDLFEASVGYVELMIEIHPEKMDVEASTLIENMKSRADSFEFLGDSAPDHPQSESIDHPTNRPAYHVVIA